MFFKNKFSLNIKSLLLLVIFTLLLFCPLVTQGNLYFVGGDDTRLYYLYPNKFLDNLAFNIISDNTLGGANTGYAPSSHIAPPMMVLSLLRHISFLNTQFLAYGLNWAFGFLFFYLFLGLWLEDSEENFFVRIVAGLFYIFSQFLLGTLYNHQLFAIFLVSIVPACLYFFVRGVKESSVHLTLLCVVVLSVFSETLSTLPWSAAVIFSSLPLLLFIFLRHKKSFLIQSLTFVVSFVFLNSHWLFHFIYSSVHNTGGGGLVNYYSSSQFTQMNRQGILGTATLFSPLNQVLNQMSLNLIEHISVLAVISIIFIFIILLGGVVWAKIKDKKSQIAYLVSISCLIVAWFFFSPNFSDWGPQVFLFLSEKIPFFTMFRNMYDKFALSLAFFYAFALATSLSLLSQRINKNFFRGILITSLLVILLGAQPLFRMDVSHEGVQAKVSGVFNDDFNNLISYLKTVNNPSRILWIPLNVPTYVNVEDKYNPGHYYSGPSPLRILADKTDYAGEFSFITGSDLFAGDKVISLLQAKDYSDLGKLFQLLNARYVIVDHQNLPSSMDPFLYGIDNKILNLQTEDFKKEILGKKIADFGSRYSMYEINNKYYSNKLFLADNLNAFPSSDNSNLSFWRDAVYQYQISVKNLSGSKYLVFLDPYYRDWTLYLGNGKVPFQENKNILAYNYANAWLLDPTYIENNFDSSLYSKNPDGSINLKLTLYFKPQKYTDIFNAVSLASFILILAFIAFQMFKSRTKYV